MDTAQSSRSGASSASIKRSLAAAVTVASVHLVYAAKARGADIVSTYNGPDHGGWSVSANWVNNPAGSFFPNDGVNGGATFDAGISRKIVDLTSPIVIEKLTLSGGAIAGIGTLTTKNTFTWNDGALSFSGTLTAAGGMSLGGSAAKSIGNGTTLYNGTGTATWSAGDFSNGAQGTFSNRATLNITTDADFLGGRFYNAGTLTKSAGPGETRFASLFMNSGTVTVNVGTLALEGGGTQTGSVNGASGTTLRFAGGHNFPTTSIHADSVIFSDGLNQVGLNSAYFASNTTLLPSAELRMTPRFIYGGVTLDGGTLTSSSSSSVSVEGPVTWNSGSLKSGVNADGGIAINTSAVKTLIGKLYIPSVPVKAVATWNGGDIVALNGSISVSGIFDIRSDNTFTGSQFLVDGSLTKSAGAGVTSLTARFYSQGTVAVNSGSLKLSGGGTFYSGSLTGAPGTSVRLNGDNSIRSTVSLDAFVLEAGNTSFSAPATAQSLAFQAGSVTFNTLSVKDLTIGNGTFRLDNPLTDVTKLNWNGNAIIYGNIQTESLSITGQSEGVSRTFFGRLVAANTDISEPVTVTLGAGTAFNVPVGGTFVLGGAGHFGGSGSSFNNSGVFTKTSSVETTWVPQVSNAGSINIQSGLLRFDAPFNQTGNLTVAPGAQGVFGVNATFEPSSTVNASSLTIEKGLVSVKGIFKVSDRLTLGGSTTFFPGSKPDFTGATVAFATNSASAFATFNSGTPVPMDGLELPTGANLGGSDTITVSNYLHWRGGIVAENVNVLGPATIAGAIAELRGANTLSLAGDTTLTTNISLDPNATLAISPTGSFSFMGNYPIGGGTVQNAGVINRTIGTGTASINSTFNNSGTVSLSTGTLAMTRGGTHTGQFLAAPGTTLQFSGRHSFGAGARIDAASVAFSGTNAIDIAGPYAAVTTTVDRAPVTLRGALSFAPGATLALSNGASLDLRSDAGSPADSNLVMSVANSSTAISGTQHLASLSVSGTAASTVTLSRPVSRPASPSVLVTRALEITERGNLQIDDNALIVDDDPSGASSLAPLRSHILAGFDAAASTHFASGLGITSAAASNNSATAIGYALASEVLTLTGGHGTFLGEDVNASSVLVRYTLAGDADLSGGVDFNDLVKLAQNYNTQVSASGDSWWVRGDFTYDGVVDFNDLVKLAQNYNAPAPQGPIPQAGARFEQDLAAAFATVPEPSLLGVLVLPLLTRRRRRT
jgi:hypothetical protein